jgi:hypothetical protein
VTRDHGEDKRTFAPGKLDVVVHGLPDDAAYDVYQASDGRFFITLWRNAEEPGGGTVDVTLTFANPIATISEYVVSLGETEPCQLVTNDDTIIVALDASARVLVIDD